MEDETMDTAAAMRLIEQHRQACSRARPSWMAIAGMLLSVTAPVCGWMVSLSNRVSVLEEKTTSLATAAQVTEVKQKIEDWIAESEREHSRIDQHVTSAGRP